jgi:membrane-bound metal-dependent hydrolase YbcI (DUF457 family)
MDWRAHVGLGFIFTIIFTFLINYWFSWYDIYKWNYSIATIILLLEIIVIALICPLVPDLDHPISVLHRWLLGLGLFMVVSGLLLMALNSNNWLHNDQWLFFLVVGTSIAVMTFLLPIMTHHRGIVHSIPFCLVVGVGIWILTNSFQLGVLAIVGTYSHLIFDGLFLKMI